MTKPLRAESLDALRGLTIAMMVLCGAIIMWVLPAWMSHCQEPPPDSAFHPEIYGITWVDLVFPFFLFSMGAAFPFSLGGRIDRGLSRISIFGSIASRAAKLTFFAIYLQHVYPWASQCPDPTTKSIIGLAAFILLFPCFTRFSFIKNAWVRRTVTIVGYAAATWLMFYSDSFSGANYQLSPNTIASALVCGVLFILPLAFARIPSRFGMLRRWLIIICYAAASWRFLDLLNHCEITSFLWSSNIIILVLADMALFGMLFYMLTYRAPRTRLAILAVLLGFFLSADTPGSWQQEVYNWTPLPWFYQMRYLKYLFVVIPGVYAGEWLRAHLTSLSNSTATLSSSPASTSTSSSASSSTSSSASSSTSSPSSNPVDAPTSDSASNHSASMSSARLPGMKLPHAAGHSTPSPEGSVTPSARRVSTPCADPSTPPARTPLTPCPEGSGPRPRTLFVGLTALLGVAIIVANLWGLFVRELAWNLLLSVVIACAIGLTARRCGRDTPLLVKLTDTGAWLLMLGLAFEAYQGGIRKDDPTYSYYFVTSGLAFYMLSTLYIICDVYCMRRLMAPLTMAGKNPMIAYVATSLLIVPLLNLLGIGDQHIDFWASTPFLGFMRGLLLTVLAVAVAAAFTKAKWFWRT